MTRKPTGRSRGRPRSSGNLTCDRCGAATAQIRVIWPDGRICGVCFHHATRTVAPAIAAVGMVCCRVATGSGGFAGTAPESARHWDAPAAGRRANATDAESALSAHFGTTSAT